MQDRLQGHLALVRARFLLPLFAFIHLLEVIGWYSLFSHLTELHPDYSTASILRLLNSTAIFNILTKGYLRLRLIQPTLSYHFTTNPSSIPTSHRPPIFATVSERLTTKKYLHAINPISNPAHFFRLHRYLISSNLLIITYCSSTHIIVPHLCYSPSI